MPKIRRGTLSVNGSAIADVVNVDWNDNTEYDRRAVDTEMSGKPVMMKKQGSGSFEMLAGNVPSGYGTADAVINYKEVSVAAGVETEADKSVTFTDVTFNSGGNLDNDAGPGSRRINFEYGTQSEGGGGGS